MKKETDPYKEVKLSEVLKDGYLVAIEGDNSLYDEDLDKWLKENVKNYILLNNIYDNPEKLFQLKDIKIDAFIFQTTGLNPKLKSLISLYTTEIGNYPKHFITVFRDSEDFFWEVFRELKEYEVYQYNEVDKNDLHMTRQDHSCKEKEA